MPQRPLPRRRTRPTHPFLNDERQQILAYLGSVLHEARLGRRRSARDIGRAIGLTSKSVRRIELGDYQGWPDLEKVLLFAREVAVAPAALFPPNPTDPRAELMRELAGWPPELATLFCRQLRLGSPRLEGSPANSSQ